MHTTCDSRTALGSSVKAPRGSQDCNAQLQAQSNSCHTRGPLWRWAPTARNRAASPAADSHRTPGRPGARRRRCAGSHAPRRASTRSRRSGPVLSVYSLLVVSYGVIGNARTGPTGGCAPRAAPIRSMGGRAGGSGVCGRHARAPGSAVPPPCAGRHRPHPHPLPSPHHSCL